MRGIVKFEFDHGRGVERRNPEHGYVIKFRAGHVLVVAKRRGQVLEFVA